MKQKIKKRFALLLSVCMLLSLFPSVSFAAGPKKITDDFDLIANEITEFPDGVQWDAASKTLTLTDVEIQPGKDGASAPISVPADTTILIEGKVTLVAQKNEALYAEGALTIKGGELILKAGKEGSGIQLSDEAKARELTIENCKLTAEGGGQDKLEKEGLGAKNVTIRNSSITASGGWAGVSAVGGNILLENTTVSAKGGMVGMVSIGGTITVKNSSVTAEGGDMAILAQSYDERQSPAALIAVSDVAVQNGLQLVLLEDEDTDENGNPTPVWLSAYAKNGDVAKKAVLMADKADKVGPSSDGWGNPYADVNSADWFYGAVKYVTQKKLIDGVFATTFAPHADTSRAVLVEALWRAEDKPDGGEPAFTDVAKDSANAKSIAWAAKNGIVNGVGNNKFEPARNVQRQELAAILYRFAQFKKLDVSVGENTNILSYKDFSQISEYAIPAMQWACGAGILQGKGEGVLDPAGPATRAEYATILQRFLK